MRKPLKTFNLKMFTQPEEELFSKFQKTVNYHGDTTREVLMRAVRDYMKKMRVHVRLASETEVLAEAKRIGLGTTKAVLIKHRTRGNINGFWRANDDGRIVYELVPVIKFLKQRQGKGSGGWLNRKADEQNTTA